MNYGGNDGTYYCQSKRNSTSINTIRDVPTVRIWIKNKIVYNTHVDNTARVQTVSFETSPKYYKLIKKIYNKLTKKKFKTFS